MTSTLFALHAIWKEGGKGSALSEMGISADQAWDAAVWTINVVHYGYAHRGLAEEGADHG